MLHIGTASINTTPKDWEGNTRSILEIIDAAKQQSIRLLCLPELAISGYGCEDDFHAPYVHATALEMLLHKIVPATQDIAVAVGLPLFFKGAVFNTIAFVVNGTLAGLAAKKHLAGDGIHYEPRFFKPWPVDTVSTYRVRLADSVSLEVPLGDLLFELDGVQIGFEICEDAWVAARPGIGLAQRGVHVILNPSASHFSFLKTHTRERFVVEGSRSFNCAYVYANLLGNEAGRAIYDGECMIAHGGELLSRGPRFSFRPWVLTSACADVQNTQVKRSRIASYTPALDNNRTIRVAFSPKVQIGNNDPLPEPMTHATQAFATSANLKAEEFARAVALGLYDYKRKAAAKGFAISLSGGADSAACAALVYLMAKFAIADNPQGFARSTGLDTQRPLREIVSQLLTCVYQKTVNSSTTTETAARTLATEIGARFHVFDVQPLVDNYEKLLTDYLGRDLTWEADDIARQNIQARCRAPSIWTIANVEGYLLITTSNRSEAAVGYCTMDGDTAGSIAPLGGIDKDFLLKWLHWAETEHLPSLRTINVQKPTAELRPQTSRQTDEADLMPYGLLNYIQKAAVIDKQSPLEIYQRIRQHARSYPEFQYEDQQLYIYIERYFTLWSRNQWKRERYAPSFHVDDENLDPRTWCRFPILSGCYKYELKQLKETLGLLDKY